jgi:TM2 domain-containing membrane protein YozV
MFCNNCGAEINDNAVVCVKCGCAVNRVANNPASVINGSTKDWVTTLLLCFLLGFLGVHRFYVGKTGTGILQLLTGGGCGVWALIDFIVICMGNFTDAEGKVIKNKN